MIDHITRTIYTNVCRGLFEKDKLIFSFLISTSINKQAKILDELLFGVFLRGAGVMDKSKQPPNPDKEKLGNLAWDLAYYLDIHFERFLGITKSIISKLKLW